MWNSINDYKLKKLEKTVQCIYCSIRNGNNEPETDPIFTASPAFTITQSDIDSWNSTFTESDPVFMASPAHSIVQGHITFLNSLDYNSLNNKPDLSLKADLVSGVIPVGQIPRIPPQQIVTNAATYNLVPTAGLIHVFFTGTTTTFNLPPIANNSGLTILLFNGGSGNVTIAGNAADPNSVIDGNLGANSTTLTTLTPMTIFSINNKWVTKP